MDEQHGDWVRQGSDVSVWDAPRATSPAGEMHATAIMLWQAGAHLQGQSVSFEEEACMSMAAADVSRGDDALQSFSDSHTAPFASFDNV